MFKFVFFTVVLVFYLQGFYYVQDIYVAYLIQKIILPLVGLIFFVFFLIKGRINKYVFTIGVLYVFIFLSSSFAATYNYDQSITKSMMAEGKLLSFFSVFVFCTLISRFASGDFFYKDLKNSLFAITAFFVVLHFIIDVEALWTKESQIFIQDSKGFRLKLPSIFPILLLYMSLVSLVNYRKKIDFIIIIFAALYLILFQKQRVELLSVIFACSIYVFYKSSGVTKNIALLASILFVGLLMYHLLQGGVDGYIGGNFETRVYRFYIIQDFIRNSDLVGVFFGSGLLNQSFVTYEDKFGTAFSAGDFGWIGIYYEFGLLGIVVFFVIYFILYKIWRRCVGEIGAVFGLYLMSSFFLSLIAPHLYYSAGIFSALVFLACQTRKT